jgi:hypothetical protein
MVSPTHNVFASLGYQSRVCVAGREHDRSTAPQQVGNGYFVQDQGCPFHVSTKDFDTFIGQDVAVVQSQVRLGKFYA